MKFFFFSLVLIGLVIVIFPHLLYLIVKIFSWIFRFRCAYRPFGLAALVLLGLWLLLAVYGNVWGRFRHEQKTVNLELSQLPEAFKGYRAVHISDLHLDGFAGHEERIQQIVNEINALHPDAIFFTGDLVSLTEEELMPFVPILSQLKAKDGVYSVLGNHDYLPYNRMMSDRERATHLDKLISMEREQLGWNLLLNQNAVIHRGNDSIAIVGTENQSMGVHSVVKRGDLKKAMEGTEGMCHILLTHDPTHWKGEVVGKTDIPLTLSGHTHGGQMNIFGLFYVSTFIYKEHAGLYSENGQRLYVNIGIGGTMPMRVGATPEITLLRLE